MTQQTGAALVGSQRLFEAEVTALHVEDDPFEVAHGVLETHPGLGHGFFRSGTRPVFPGGGLDFGQNGLLSMNVKGHSVRRERGRKPQPQER